MKFLTLLFLSLLSLLQLTLPIVSYARSCSVITPSINFGAYDVFNNANYDTSGNLTLSCTGRPDYTIAISQGTSTLKNYKRVMINTMNKDKLVYDLYTDATYSTVWGNGAFGTAMIEGRAPPGSLTIPVYARAAGGQDVAIGSYIDTLVVTITYT